MGNFDEIMTLVGTAVGIGSLIASLSSSRKGKFIGFIVSVLVVTFLISNHLYKISNHRAQITEIENQIEAILYGRTLSTDQLIDKLYRIGESDIDEALQDLSRTGRLSIDPQPAETKTEPPIETKVRMLSLR
jgi:hypothetical protein